jgi:hypothetical protein
MGRLRTVLVCLWFAAVTTLFVGAFLTPEAATCEPLGRYMYMAALAASLAILLLGVMRGNPGCHE